MHKWRYDFDWSDAWEKISKINIKVIQLVRSKIWNCKKLEALSKKLMYKYF